MIALKNPEFSSYIAEPYPGELTKILNQISNEINCPSLKFWHFTPAGEWKKIKLVDICFNLPYSSMRAFCILS